MTTNYCYLAIHYENRVPTTILTIGQWFPAETAIAGIDNVNDIINIHISCFILACTLIKPI